MCDERRQLWVAWKRDPVENKPGSKWSSDMLIKVSMQIFLIDASAAINRGDLTQLMSYKILGSRVVPRARFAWAHDRRFMCAHHLCNEIKAAYRVVSLQRTLEYIKSIDAGTFICVCVYAE